MLIAIVGLRKHYMDQYIYEILTLFAEICLYKVEQKMRMIGLRELYDFSGKKEGRWKSNDCLRLTRKSHDLLPKK